MNEIDPIYSELKKNLYSNGSSLFSPSKDIKTEDRPVAVRDIGSGLYSGHFEVSGGYIQSHNFETSANGWRLNSNGTVDFNSVGALKVSAIIDMDNFAIQNVDYVSGSSGGIDFNESGRIQISNHLDPSTAGTLNMGGSERYWGYINTMEISKQGGGGFGWFDEGVKLQDGRIVPDTEAIKQMRAHPTKKTDYGKPIIDMDSIPEDVIIRPKKRDGTPIEKNKDGKYIEIVDGKIVEHTEGERVFVMMSIMIGAIKELSNEITILKQKQKEV